MNNHLDYDTLEFIDTYSGIQFKDRAGNQSPGVMFGAIRINGELSPLYVPKDYIKGSLANKKENNFIPPKGMELRKVICLVGSVRFKETFEKVAKEESLKGNIVLTPIFFDEHEKEKIHNREFLDELHYEKIRISDEVLVINCNNYIGESTAKEIEFAYQIMKSVRFLEFLEPKEESTIIDHPCSFEEHEYTKEDISRLIMMQMQDCDLKISSFINISFVGKGFLNDKLSVRINKNELTKSEIDLLKQLYSTEELSSTGWYILFVEKETIEKNIDKARERFKITVLPPRYDNEFKRIDPNDL